MASKSGDLFRLSLGKWADKVDGTLDALARQAPQELAKTTVIATPVDTGFLRGSWQPAIGEAAVAEKPTHDVGGALAAAAISAVIADMKTGDTFHMRNNAAYARRLEYGFVGEDSLGRTYNQTGRYYVRDSVAKWPQIVEQVLADLKK